MKKGEQMLIHIYSLTHYKSEKSEVGFKGIEAYFTFFVNIVKMTIAPIWSYLALCDSPSLLYSLGNLSHSLSLSLV